jgi:hypothetical protein
MVAASSNAWRRALMLVGLQLTGGVNHSLTSRERRLLNRDEVG